MNNGRYIYVVSDSTDRAKAISGTLTERLPHMCVENADFDTTLEHMKKQSVREGGEVFVVDMHVDKNSSTSTLVGKLGKGQLVVLIEEESKTMPIRVEMHSRTSQLYVIAISPSTHSLDEVVAEKVAHYLHTNDVLSALKAINTVGSNLNLAIGTLINAVQSGWGYLDEETRDKVRVQFVVDESCDPVHVSIKRY